MSPTIAELAVGLIAAVLVFMLAIQLLPLVAEWFRSYVHRAIDDEIVEKDDDQYEE
jgi:hypothetical protein